MTKCIFNFRSTIHMNIFLILIDEYFKLDIWTIRLYVGKQKTVITFKKVSLRIIDRFALCNPKNEIK